LVFLLALLLVGCNSGSSPTFTPTAQSTLPPPDVRVTSGPDVEPVVRNFLDAWKAEDYSSMYSLLTSSSQAKISLEEFTQEYEDVANQMLLNGVDYEILSVTNTTGISEASYRVTLISSVFGEIVRDTAMKLEQVNSHWLVDWDTKLIIPELAGGNYLRLDREGITRATIYDRKGEPLAGEAEAAAFGVWPGYVDLTDSDTLKGLVPLLANLSGNRTETVVGLIENSDQTAYLPFGEIPADQDPRRLNLLSTWGAAIVSNYSSRLYYGSGIGGVAPHVVGYVSSIQKEEIDAFRQKGYSPTEKVGRKGLEAWGEDILRGKRGGTLYVFNPEGKLVSELASAPNVPGSDIYTTIDREFQIEVQKARSGFSGAIVVLERDTGRVLAMASKPGFDQNAYQTENYNWITLINEIVNNPLNPQFNRATQGQYPLGSVFKLVTLGAALQSGRFTESTTYNCGYVFDELPGFPRYDWTWDHFQQDGITQPSGLLTLPEGLIRSCNPFFWHIGLDLYNVGLTTAISGMARGYGLGSLTGIEGVEEETGNVPDPQSQIDAINLAIGQGDFLTTPLQVASFVAALGNGGTLYTPQLVEAVVAPGQLYSSTFQVKERGVLPLDPQYIKLIQKAMVGVVTSTNPLGTAVRTFQQFSISVAGKTGTATAPVGNSHAWFAGYTFEGRQDKPDIAVVVLAENAGEGSEFAAPIFRRVVELYFFGKPLRIYRWEAQFDITRSPTPIVTPSVTPEEGGQ
jgi:penicillin-binding protein 2